MLLKAMFNTSYINLLGLLSYGSWIYNYLCNQYLSVGFTITYAISTYQLDLQLPIQSVPIATDVVRSNLDQGEVYNIMW